MKKAKLDTQGRIVIPKPFRREMNISEGSPLVITFEGGAVVVRPDDCTSGLCGSPVESERTLRLCDKCIGKAMKFYRSEGKN